MASSRRMPFRWPYGYLFPRLAQTDLARAAPLVVTSAWGQADLAGISLLERPRFGRRVVLAHRSGRPARRRAAIARLTRISPSAGARSVTPALLESASTTVDSSSNSDCPSLDGISHYKEKSQSGGPQWRRLQPVGVRPCKAQTPQAEVCANGTLHRDLS